MRKITITKENTLLNALLEANLPYSRTKLKSLLKHECISINHEVTSQFDEPLYPGDIIHIVEYNKNFESPLDIIYEDKNIIVINKPSGLLSISTPKKELITAYRLVSEHVKKSDPSKKIFVIHRLDRDTSGIIMFAKSQFIQKRYQETWNELVLDRTYVVIVEGVVKKDKDTITSLLKEAKNRHVVSSSTGLKAITHYEVIKRSETNTLLKIQIDTGRKNQIRVHMHDIKHSVIGDKKYGAESDPIKRMGLHAYRLKIINPLTQKPLTFIAPMPKKFERYMKYKIKEL